MLFLNFGLDLTPHAMVLRAYIDGTSGDDTLEGGSGDDTIAGGIGGDSLEGNNGGDNILGASGDDTIDGGIGGDVVKGGFGSDEIRGGSGDDVIEGGESVLGGADDDDLIFGEHGDDTIRGDVGNDTAYGGSGADILSGGAGADALTGGAGDDTFIVDGLGDGNGDVINGGDGTDVLDLTGSFPEDIDYRAYRIDKTEDEDGTGYDGTVTYLDAGGNETGTLTFTDIEDIICFARGTLIETSRGAVAVEDLKEGDQVLTMDNGLQPIRWIGAKSVPATGKLAPIEFAPQALKSLGAVGNDRALRVSRMHRMLVTGWQAELLFGEHEVLIPAKMLVNDHSVRPVEGGDVEYFHIMFDAHEIVYAEGVPAESFHPGRQGFGALAEESRGRDPDPVSRTGIQQP